jgi:hypothetical protein
MSNELISLLVLVLIFVIGTTMPVNTPEEKRDYVFKRLMQWGMSMVLIARRSPG